MFKKNKVKQIQSLIIVFVISFLLILISPTLIVGRSLRSPEIRGVWLTNIDSDVLFARGKTAASIDRLAQLNFNTLYPTIWNWGYTLYPSKVAKEVIGIEIDPTDGIKRRDILQEIIQQGHSKQMAVIPWFEFGFMAPADSQLAKLYPQWLTKRQDGSKVWLEGKTHELI